MSDCVFLRRGMDFSPVTVTLVPSSWSHSGSGTVSNGDNCLTDTNSTTYARKNGTKGAWNTFKVYFDTSFVPENATITNVSFKAKSYSTSLSYQESTLRPFGYNNYRPYSAVAMNTSAASSYIDTFSGQSFTRQQLQNAGITFSHWCDSDGTSAGYMIIYGAELTFTYSII